MGGYRYFIYGMVGVILFIWMLESFGETERLQIPDIPAHAKTIEIWQVINGEPVYIGTTWMTFDKSLEDFNQMTNCRVFFRSILNEKGDIVPSKSALLMCVDKNGVEAATFVDYEPATPT